MLQRNCRYFLSQLVPGDRFYFYGDKKKRVLMLSDYNTFFKTNQNGFWIGYASTLNDNGEIEIHKSKRLVIFLRNINQVR